MSTMTAMRICGDRVRGSRESSCIGLVKVLTGIIAGAVFQKNAAKKKRSTAPCGAVLPGLYPPPRYFAQN